MMKIHFLWPLASTVLLVTSVNAQTLVPSDAIVEGKSITEWAAEWWQWGVQQTPQIVDGEEITIFDDPTIGENQSGPVYFLTSAGSYGENFDLNNPPPIQRNYEVPHDKYLLIPIINTSLGAAELGLDPTDPDTPNQVKDETNATVDSYTDLLAQINGVELTDDEINARRYEGAFTYNAVENNVFGVPTGDSGPAYHDGYFLMFEPVGTETFDLKLQGILPDIPEPFNFVINTEDTITGAVMPEPSIILGLITIGGLICGTAKRGLSGKLK